ncbi:hypothetical protein ACI78R_23035 [Geodermatophilus sp. SYSU D01106]
MSGWAADPSAVGTAVLVAVLLTAEAGLLVGVVIPASSLVLGLGVLAGAGALPPAAAVLTAAGATVLGAALGHHAAARGGPGSLLPTAGPLGRLLPVRARALAERLTAPWVEAVGRGPVRAAAAAQFVAGARTLAPRVAARAGVRPAEMLRGTVPAALVWASCLVSAGALASSALPLVRSASTALGLPLLVVATAVVLVRRRAGARRAGPRPA